MIIPQSMPKIKRFFNGICTRQVPSAYMVRLMAGFLDHRGRMSASQAAGSVASQARHPAGVSRFLRRYARAMRGMRSQLAQRLLEAAGPEKGAYVFILDATDATQQGVRAENTFS